MQTARQLQLDIQRIRDAGAPLVAIQTADPAATMRGLSDYIGDGPLLRWDNVRGAIHLNAKGELALAQIISSAKLPTPAALANLPTLLDALRFAPDETVIYLLNPHLFFDKPSVVQGLWNLRDIFKGNGRAAVMLGTGLEIPPALKGDVVVLVEPMPTRGEIRDIVERQCLQADPPVAPEPPTVEAAVDALTGVEPFMVETFAAMSVTRGSLDIEFLHGRRCVSIATTRGLTAWQGTERFDQIGGNANVKRFIERYTAGENPFGGVIWIDEIEKAFQGSRSSENHVGGDQNLVMLTWMADHKIPAILLVGHPGTGKSEIAKATGASSGRLTLRFDLGAMLGHLVGNSQAYIRDAIAKADAVTGHRPFIIATSNDISSLSPEMLSRFMAIFFFDLPDDEEKPVIWNLQMDAYKLTKAQRAGYDELVSRQWTGREIFRCCELARNLRVSIADASEYVVPLSISNPERIRVLRTQAENTFLSASYPGFYQQNREIMADAGNGSRRRVRG